MLQQDMDAGVADEVHFPRTADGWRLALHRYRPRTGGTASPVILCGGYGCNRHFLDYDERYSLARFLARSGFDAWVLELRGRGLAQRAAEVSGSRSWTFDDLATNDVPAAIAHVAERTGRAVTWLGHSMGGMLLYAYAGSLAGGGALLKAGVTIASPIGFPRAVSAPLSQLGMLLLRLPFSETIHQRLVLGMLWGVLGNSSALTVGMNPYNIDHPTVGRALRLSLENVPRIKLQQFARWAAEGAFCSVDGRTDYRAGLASVRLPLLVIAGSADRLATPQAVGRALDYLAAAETTYVQLGREHGHTVDYGHVDLVLGRAAPAEVFPLITGWLREHQ
jgi:predicted alpha/beta hydrolase